MLTRRQLFCQMPLRGSSSQAAARSARLRLSPLELVSIFTFPRVSSTLCSYIWLFSSFTPPGTPPASGFTRRGEWQPLQPLLANGQTSQFYSSCLPYERHVHTNEKGTRGKTFHDNRYPGGEKACTQQVGVNSCIYEQVNLLGLCV